MASTCVPGPQGPARGRDGFLRRRGVVGSDPCECYLLKGLLAWVLARRLLQRLERFLLRLGQLLRHAHLHARDQVAAAGAVQLGCAAAADAQELAILGAGRDLQGHRPVRGRHLDGRAERGLGVADRHLDLEVGRPAPLVQLRRRDPGDDVQGAGGAAAPAGLALAAQPDPRPVLHARRNLDGVALRPPLAAGTAAARARVFDHRAVAAAARARLREPEQALALGDDAAAVALGADLRRRARLRPGAAALSAGELERDGDSRLHALERVLERQADLDLDVVASLRARLARPAGPAAEAAAEEIAEEAREVAQVAEIEGDPARPGPELPVRRAVRVVGLALLGVGEDVVGGLDLLEALLGGLVVGVGVRVVLAGELAVRLLDLVLRGVLRDAKGLVQRRHSATITLAGRRTWSPNR